MSKVGLTEPQVGPVAGDLEIEVCGDRLVLLPERAVYRPSTRTLLVADPHWGKAAAFRALGVAVPRGTTHEGLARLSALVERTGAGEVVFLGDFFHAREGKAPATLEALGAWRRGHAELPLTLVRGNHDFRAGDPPDDLDIRCVNGPLLAEPFAFAHHPVAAPACYVLAGHVHPCVTLVGRARQRQRFRCFLFGAEVGILPAFGDFTGTAGVDPRPGDRVYLVAGDQVVEAPARR